MKRLAGITAAVLVLSAGSVFAEGAQKAVDDGKKLYDTYKCADCHTIAGKGGKLTKQYKMDGVATKLSAADIKKWLTDTVAMEAKLEKPTKPKMSSKKYAFKDPEVEALSAYLATLK